MSSDTITFFNKLRFEKKVNLINDDSVEVKISEDFKNYEEFDTSGTNEKFANLVCSNFILSDDPDVSLQSVFENIQDHFEKLVELEKNMNIVKKRVSGMDDFLQKTLDNCGTEIDIVNNDIKDIKNILEAQDKKISDQKEETESYLKDIFEDQNKKIYDQKEVTESIDEKLSGLGNFVYENYDKNHDVLKNVQDQCEDNKQSFMDLDYAKVDSKHLDQKIENVVNKITDLKTDVDNDFGHLYKSINSLTGRMQENENSTKGKIDSVYKNLEKIEYYQSGYCQQVLTSITSLMKENEKIIESNSQIDTRLEKTTQDSQKNLSFIQTLQELLEEKDQVLKMLVKHIETIESENKKSIQDMQDFVNEKVAQFETVLSEKSKEISNLETEIEECRKETFENQMMTSQTRNNLNTTINELSLVKKKLNNFVDTESCEKIYSNTNDNVESLRVDIINYEKQTSDTNEKIKEMQKQILSVKTLINNGVVAWE